MTRPVKTKAKRNLSKIKIPEKTWDNLRPIGPKRSNDSFRPIFISAQLFMRLTKKPGTCLRTLNYRTLKEGMALQILIVASGASFILRHMECDLPTGFLQFNKSSAGSF